MAIKPVGICPKCNEIIPLVKREVFFTCPECGAQIISREAREILDTVCHNPKNVNDVIELAMGLEERGEVEAAISILDVLRKIHEYNETVGYAFIRMTGFEPEAVRRYLDMFAEAGGIKPFAQDVLDNIMGDEFMMMTPQIEKYIANKLHPSMRKQYREKLGEIKCQYTSGARENQSGIYLMYAFYILCGALNIAMSCLMMWVMGLDMVWLLLITLAILCSEFTALFIHNRVFGQRIGIPIHEQYMMIMFMCSIPLIIGAAIIGGLN